MLIAWLSRYRPRYVRSLAYMLQATEYDTGDYLEWFLRVRDFGNVEQRKQLTKTSKARLVMLLTWLLSVVTYGSVALLALQLTGSARIIALVLGVLVAPYVIGIGIIVPLMLVRILVQKPMEFFITRRAHAALSKHPAVKIAIAGSFGKTSMREVLKAVLEQGKKVAAPPHSYNTPLGISRFVQNLHGDEEILIFELGEYYPGDVRKLCRLVQPDIGVITGINEAHLKKFKTLDKTVGTIFELADWLGDKPVYVNEENELAAQAAKSQHTLYSRKGAGRWKVKSVATDLSGTQLVLAHGDSEIKATSQLLGLHQVGPLAAAAEIAASFGLTNTQIKAGLEATKPFDHRLEPKEDGAGVITLDDSYNGNPDGVKAVIDFLGSLSGHRRFYVTPGLVEMGARTKQVHEQIGRDLAKAGIEKVILIRNSVTPFIEAGLKQAGYKGDVIWFDDAIAAFSAVPHMTVKGDVVLLQNDWPDQYA